MQPNDSPRYGNPPKDNKETPAVTAEKQKIMGFVVSPIAQLAGNSQTHQLSSWVHAVEWFAPQSPTVMSI